MMLGYLLARNGVETTVLEKHGDFLRDFRGDTIHPSTLEIIHELGLLDEFLSKPHQRVERLGAVLNKMPTPLADFSHLPTHCKYIALMPQWDFLNFFADQAKRFLIFKLHLNTEATDLICEGDQIKGVQAQTANGAVEFFADLVVGADGRHSRIREAAGLKPIDLGAPMDVLWMRLPKSNKDPAQTLGYLENGKILIMLDRGDYWQCAHIVEKGSFDQIQRAGWPAFRSNLAAIAPFISDRVDHLTDWKDVKLLTVAVNRLPTWYRAGLLCVGDSAHAMSPIGGVGINLAIQDAVAAANHLATPLKNRAVTVHDLAAVQKRRELPARVTQNIQVFIQNRVLVPALQNKLPKDRIPFPIRLLKRFPMLQRIPARLVGIGIRPEHVAPH
jgi:2-polyprenyl-6-methoxyphenol hydroxylase-like FAD-dependent oxidoreductase